VDESKGGPDHSLLIVALLSILAWAPLLYPGFIQSHTGLGAVYDALSVRSPLQGWLPAFGAPGDGPLATWLLVVLKAAVGPLAALKLLYAGGVLLSGVGMFLAARRLWGSQAAVVAAAAYIYTPYHLALVYVRGALAELLLFVLTPWLLLALLATAEGASRRRQLAVAMLAALLVLANAGLGLLAACVCVIVAFQTSGVSVAKPPRFARPGRFGSVAAVVAGIAGGFFVLLPAGGRMFANLPDWREHFVYIHQLFAPTWAFGESVAGWGDAAPFQLGVVPLALAILALWGAAENGAADRRTILTLCALLVVLVVLMLPVSASLWQLLRLFVLAAYPWQFLGMAALALALLTGLAARDLAGKHGWLVVTAVLLSAIVLASYGYLAPRVVDAADLPNLSHPPLAQLGDDVLLLDARFDGEARAGGSLRLTLIWQARRQPQGDYHIFAHLVDAGGALRGQQDVRPQNGQRPTNTWLRGEIVSEHIQIPVAANAPPGEYRIDVGMYLLATVERLPVAGTEQRAFVLGPIVIKQ
jgi:hypothetical protein